jgi:hypothetical protein
VSTCTSDFRIKFPDSRLLPRVSMIEQQAALACQGDEAEMLKFAEQCASQKSADARCEVAGCFRDYQAKFPRGRSIDLVNDRVTRAKAECQASQEPRILADAKRCAEGNACGAEQCFSSYRNQFPNGSLLSQVESALQTARQTCAAASRGTSDTSSTPVQNPFSTPTQTPTPTQVLRSGNYSATRGYTGPKSRSDAVNCPPNTSFTVRIQDELLTFEGVEQTASGSYVRRWSGSIDQRSGNIAVRGSDAVPRTKNALTIAGRYNSASIDSDYCGPGFFRINGN